jgi:ribonuclease-3
MLLPRFQNPALLQQALTHSTYAYEHPTEGPDNERLEFLGDSILEFVVRDLLFARYPAMAEGEMSKRGDCLVDESCLATLAVQLEIPPRLRLGSGAQHERDNPSVQADALEAVIGAYRLDSGVTAAYRYGESIFAPLVDRALELQATDPVRAFQEYVQAHVSPTPPIYRDRGTRGPDHARVFSIEVCVGDTSYGVGQGRSKKAARKQAALNALQYLKGLADS